MEYMKLGRTGLDVSRIWLGMMSYGDPRWRPWVLAEDEAEALVARALALGINTFDTADVYSAGVSEEVTGRLLLKYARREEVVIATKVFFPHGGYRNAMGLSRKHIMDSIDTSLARLGTDHVDLYQIHRWDSRTPIEETMEALHDVVKDGKARYIGASSMYAWQFAKAQRVAALHGWTEFVSMQPHYNLLYREAEREMLPQCHDMGVGVVPWSPLARGLLARPPSAGRAPTEREASDDITRQLYDESDVPVIEAVGRVAARHDVSRAEIAIAWLMRQSAVTAPIVGATKVTHLEAAVAATQLALHGEDVEELETPYRPHRVRGH